LLANILDYVLFRKLNKATKAKLVESAFFTFNGMLFGVLLNDIFKMLGGDLNTSKTGYRLYNHDVMQDELYGYLISLGTATTGILPFLQIYHKWTNNIALGLGMAVGVFYSNTSEQGKYVGLVQRPAK
jgi:hypothetical protein